MSFQINLVHMRQDLEILEKAIERVQARVDRTIAQYGTGVRPSWVSAELALDRDDIERRMANAAKLRRQIERVIADQKKSRPPLTPLK